MNRTILRGLAAAAALAAGTALAAGSVVSITAFPAKVKPNQEVTFTIAGAGDMCGVKYQWEGNLPLPTPGGGYLNYTIIPPSGQNVAQYKTKPSGGGMVKTGFIKPGTYKLTVTGMVQGQPFPADPCAGMASTTVVVEDPNAVQLSPAAAQGIMLAAPLACDPHYMEKGSDKAAGELRCRRKPVQCPDGYSGGVNEATGVLTCNPVPQPSLSCPKGTPSWKWGTSYYKDGWKYYGCVKNLEPPK